MKSILLCIVFTQLAPVLNKQTISFKTSSGNTITIAENILYFNRVAISKSIEGIVYSSKYNKLIEQNGAILLFLEIANSSNYNYLSAFKITNKKALKLVDCVYNDKTQGTGPPPFTDMDKDGKLEFGGFDITERYASKDSMYYNPSQYYEINKGIIRFDSALSKKMDIKVNGVYLSNPLDRQGNCCKLIKVLKKY